MKTKQIQVADAESGRMVPFEVDEDRFKEVLDSLEPFRAKLLGEPSDFGRTANDAPEAFQFMVGQLTYTEAKSYEKQYIPMQGEEIVPRTAEAGPTAEQIRYEIEDKVGIGRRIATTGDNIPMAEVMYNDKTAPVHTGGVAYKYTQQELRASAFLRRPLPERRLATAIEMCLRHLNLVSLKGGDASTGDSGDLTGWQNNALVPTAAVTSGKQWTAANCTGKEILNDINQAILTQWTNTAYNSVVTDIGVAPGAFSALVQPRSEYSDLTLLEYILRNNLAKQLRGVNLRIFPVFGLDTAGANGVRRMVLWEKTMENLVHHVPMPLRFLAPQLENLNVKIPGEYRYSGVEWRRPKTGLYVDGI